MNIGNSSPTHSLSLTKMSDKTRASDDTSKQNAPAPGQDNFNRTELFNSFDKTRMTDSTPTVGQGSERSTAATGTDAPSTSTAGTDTRTPATQGPERSDAPTVAQGADGFAIIHKAEKKDVRTANDANGDKPEQPAANNEHLDVSNIFDDMGLTRGAKKNQGRDTKHGATKPGDAKPPKPQAPPAEPITMLPQTGDFKPSNPSVVFLDSFKKGLDTENFDDTGRGPTHGDISASAAQQNGFNVFKAQLNDDNSSRLMDYSKPLNAIENKIKSGELPLGAGDAVNVSMGQATGEDLTFKGASKMLGFEVTPDNLKEMRPKILERLGEISKDPKAPAADRERAGMALRTNESIDRLQARGIDVVHAAGNDGPDRFSIDFMNAKVQLASQSPDGTPDAFSARHSLTTPQDGVFAVEQKRIDLLSPTPIEKQNDGGTFQLRGTNVKFDAKSLQASTLGPDRIDFKRNDLTFNEKEHRVEMDMQPRHVIQSDLLNPKTMLGQSVPLERGTMGDSAKIQEQKLKPVKFESVKIQSSVPTPVDPVRTVLPGTSFANIRYFQSQFDERKIAKNH